jgi:prepilin-type N-terminal cleavage/methylation domain-containing protein
MDRTLAPWPAEPRAIHARPRRGFTLVELLVVITIIGILMSMLLPAVNQVREAGRQTKCKNNMHGLALGLELYHSKRGSYPYGTDYHYESQQNKAVWREYKGTMLHLVLPYIDMETLFALINFNTANNYLSARAIPGDNSSIIRFKVPLFICPSDDSRGLRPGPDTNPKDTRAVSNYVGCAGPRDISEGSKCALGRSYNRTYRMNRNGRINNQTPRPGVFMIHYSWRATPKAAALDQQAISHGMIRDGDAQTILLGEVRPTCSHWPWGGWWVYHNGSGVMSTIPPINYDSCSHEYEVEDFCEYYANDAMSRGFKSCHPGGAMFAMCDSSVHFFSESIDHNLFQALGAIADGIAVRLP